MFDTRTHTHDWLNSEKIRSFNVIQSLVLTWDELTAFLAKKWTEWEDVNIYNSTTDEFVKYVYINNEWRQLWWDSVDLLKSTASDTTVLEMDTERSVKWDKERLLKSFKSSRTWTMRIVFDAKNTPSFTWQTWLIYVDWVLVHTQTTTTEYKTYTKDITVGIDSIVELKAYASSINAYYYVKNFKVKYDVSELTDTIIQD